jgi:hypothetical protein
MFSTPGSLGGELESRGSSLFGDGDIETAKRSGYCMRCSIRQFRLDRSSAYHECKKEKTSNHRPFSHPHNTPSLSNPLSIILPRKIRPHIPPLQPVLALPIQHILLRPMRIQIHLRRRPIPHLRPRQIPIPARILANRKSYPDSQERTYPYQTAKYKTPRPISLRVFRAKRRTGSLPRCPSPLRRK